MKMSVIGMAIAVLLSVSMLTYLNAGYKGIAIRYGLPGSELSLTDQDAFYDPSGDLKAYVNNTKTDLIGSIVKNIDAQTWLTQVPVLGPIIQSTWDVPTWFLGWINGLAYTLPPGFAKPLNDLLSQISTYLLIGFGLYMFTGKEGS